MNTYSYGTLAYLTKVLKRDYSPEQPEHLNKYQEGLKKFVKVIANRDSSKQAVEVMRTFLNQFGESRCRVNIEAAVQNPDLLKIISCTEHKVYTVSKEAPKTEEKEQVRFRAYVLYGKAISVYKRLSKSSASKPLSAEEEESKKELLESLHSTMLRMWEDNRMPIQKSEPHEIEDILLEHELPDECLEPIVVSHEIFSSWVPLSEALVLLMPEKNPQRLEIMSMVRSSLLHVYMDDVLALNKIGSKEIFHKNSQFRGIYYIEEGEVEVKSGRIIARGWAINGKCKSSGYGWRFKPLPFLHFVCGNDNIWKQFYNDISLNEELPFKVSHVLTIDEDYEEMINGEERKFKTKKRGGNKLRFPPLTDRQGRSMMQKLVEMDKMKHYNPNYGQVEYKQEILERRINRSLRLEKVNTQPIQQNESSQKEIAKKIEYLSKKASLDNKKMKRENSVESELKRTASNENIYVASVLKKLRNLNVSTNSPREERYDRKSSHSKILGLRRYEELKQNERNHRYRGKNRYF